MKLVYDFIVLMLFFFIKIGDLVIFLTKLSLKALKVIFIVFLSLLLSFTKSLRELSNLKNKLLRKFKYTAVLRDKFIGFLNWDSLKTKKITKLKISFPFSSKIGKAKEIIEERINKKKEKEILRKPIAKKGVKPIAVYSASMRFEKKLKYFIEGGLFSFVFIFLPLLFIIFLQDLPNPKELSLRQIPQTTKIYDRNGTILYQIYATQNRTTVELDTIPKHLQQATIAIEDKDFYKHPGFNVLAIIRSLINNIQNEDIQGGSTITQQLIKSSLLTPETTISRKAKEAILAFWSERIYNKNQILEMYFNQVPYGGTAWGIEAASEVYFGKKVSDLDLSESAFLAGIPKAPSLYSPFGAYPNLWKTRQKEVLKRMADLGYISKAQEEEAIQKELVFRDPQIPIKSPHFVMYIKELLIKKYGLPVVEKGGLNVVTTIDLKIQDQAQKVVAEEVQNNEYLNLTNGATVVTNPKTGDILAMVGSRDYNFENSGNFNVTTALRQPGSSIKVVTYSAALSNGFTAATILDDSPVAFTSPGAPPYVPVNYDGKFRGKVTLRSALANSFNIPAVRTLNKIGIPTMVNFAKKMGVKNWGSPDRYGLSITLGAAEATMLDMSTVYGTLANQGTRVELNPILKITDYKGNLLEEKGQRILTGNKVLAEQKEEIDGVRVLDPGITYILSSILSDNQARALEFGTNSPLNIPGYTVAVKTGTSDNKRDNWTIGYTSNYVVTVWVGNNDNSPMSQSLASGITGAAPIWNRIMGGLLQNTQNTPFPMPLNVIEKNCFGRKEYFVKGTENSVNCARLPQSSPTPKQ